MADPYFRRPDVRIGVLFMVVVREGRMPDLLLYLIYIVPFIGFLAFAGWAADRLADKFPDMD